ncbi:GntR family transcriptional regulator [Microbacterium sp. CIAB417]|uniref:GntR family transcriptional regulator n=1 Tax=Microbacterium sp. CIAB417 TaxID=2860287 RepID=UPI001FAD416D|nr:GntR family transcriptional regulator [Microbacterium sp. CIAB417]
MTGDSRRIGRTKHLLAEEVFRHLGTAIVNGELAPKQRIRDAEIALQLHVSRMPIREALQRLERIGLVRMYPSRYTEVTEVTERVIDESREFAGYQAGFVARLAAERMNADERADSAALVDAMTAAVDDPVRYSAARNAAFLHLSEHCGNGLQHGLLRETSMALARNLRRTTPTDLDRTALVTLHARLRDALLAEDPEAAEQVSRALFGV